MNSVDFDLFLSGEWMNSSAGLAFAPHVIRVEAGEVRFISLMLEKYVHLKLRQLMPILKMRN